MPSQEVRRSCTAACVLTIYGTFAQRSLPPLTRGRLQHRADWLYLLDVSEGLDEGTAQGVQVGLRLLQMCDGLIKRPPRWLWPFLLVAAASFPALLAQLAEGSGGSLYHLRPRLDAQLETA